METVELLQKVDLSTRGGLNRVKALQTSLETKRLPTTKILLDPALTEKESRCGTEKKYTNLAIGNKGHFPTDRRNDLADTIISRFF